MEYLEVLSPQWIDVSTTSNAKEYGIITNLYYKTVIPTSTLHKIIKFTFLFLLVTTCFIIKKDNQHYQLDKKDDEVEKLFLVISDETLIWLSDYKWNW